MMKSRAFTILAALSLLLFVAVVVLWVRSKENRDVILFRRSGSQFSVSSNPGRLECHVHTTDADLGGPSGWHLGTIRWGVPIEQPDGSRLTFMPGPADWTRWHFGFKWWPAHFVDPAGTPFHQGPAAGYTVKSWKLAVPHWFLAALTGVPSCIRIVSVLRRAGMLRRMRHGLCPSCGYDLRATPERCPECGAVPTMLGGR